MGLCKTSLPQEGLGVETASKYECAFSINSRPCIDELLFDLLYQEAGGLSRGWDMWMDSCSVGWKGRGDIVVCKERISGLLLRYYTP